MPRGRMVWVSESGHRVGQDHYNAVLSDEQVDEMRDLHEDHGWGYLRLSRRFGVSKGQVKRICTYQQRAATKARCVRISP